MNSVNVLFLDDDPDLLFAYKIFFEAKSHSVLELESVDAMISKRVDVLSCDLAFLDLDLGRGKSNGVDAYQWLLSEGFSGPIFFLTAHGSRHPLVQRASLFREAEVLSKPISPDILLHLIERGKR